MLPRAEVTARHITRKVRGGVPQNAGGAVQDRAAAQTLLH
jgi:hypothetical protein